MERVLARIFFCCREFLCQTELLDTGTVGIIRKSSDRSDDASDEFKWALLRGFAHGGRRKCCLICQPRQELWHKMPREKKTKAEP